MDEAAGGSDQQRTKTSASRCDNDASMPTSVLVQVGFEFRI